MAITNIFLFSALFLTSKFSQSIANVSSFASQLFCFGSLLFMFWFVPSKRATLSTCTAFGKKMLCCLTSPLFKMFRFRTTPLPPGPKPWPFVGNLPEMLINKPTHRWIHNLMNQMGTDIAYIRLGNVHVIPVACPEISRKFLREHDAVFASRPYCMSAEVVTEGYHTIFSMPLGSRWENTKKIIASHVLSPVKHHWLTGKRLEEADNLVRFVYNQCVSYDKTGMVNVRTVAQHYCGNVIRKMLFGRRYFGTEKEDGGPGVEEEEHVEAIFKMLACLYSFCISDYLPWLRRFDLDGHEKITREATMIAGKYHDPIIEERINQWEKGTKTEEEDLLDVLINLRDADGNQLLSKDEIKGEVTELMVATVDNPSNALEWALAEMLNQPEILEKAAEELDRVVGKDRLVQESDIPNLNYIKACIREAFRLHPFAPFNVPHVSISDQIVSGYFIPKGSRVLLSRKALGRNPNVWEEPLKFKPERHLNNNGAKVELKESELRFISFSTGRRGCPGVTLGTSITVMLFARLLQGFSWEVPPNQSKIDLSEAGDSLSLAKPLVALAKPRLQKNLYPVN
ncbi:hypothetical protein SLA2020_344200 [Shorea laevis]